MSAHNNIDHNDLPTLQALRRKHALTSRQLAEAVGVPLRVEYLMEIGGVVEQTDAEQILEALSHLTGERYSLNTVQVTLASQAFHSSENQPQSRNSSTIASTIRKVKLRS